MLHVRDTGAQTEYRGTVRMGDIHVTSVFCLVTLECGGQLSRSSPSGLLSILGHVLRLSSQPALFTAVLGAWGKPSLPPGRSCLHVTDPVQEEGSLCCLGTHAPPGLVSGIGDMGRGGGPHIFIFFKRELGVNPQCFLSIFPTYSLCSRNPSKSKASRYLSVVSNTDEGFL